MVLDGTVANLTPTAARALDSTFGTTAIKAGMPLGTVHLVAKGTPNTYTGQAAEISRLSGQHVGRPGPLDGGRPDVASASRPG